MGTLGKKLPSNAKNLIGKKFGRLLVLSRNGTIGNGHFATWNCLCDCGNMTVGRGTNLLRGKKKSCGCLSRPNLVGKIFGRLTVISKNDTKKRKATYWNCLCWCGNYTSVPTAYLKNGHTSSCGCLGVEQRLLGQRKSFINRTGLRFGRLEIIGESGHSRNYVRCKCDCGNEKTVYITSLVSGRTTSCGCYSMASRMTRKSKRKTITAADVPIPNVRLAMVLGQIKKYFKE